MIDRFLKKELNLLCDLLRSLFNNRQLSLPSDIRGVDPVDFLRQAEDQAVFLLLGEPFLSIIKTSFPDFDVAQVKTRLGGIQKRSFLQSVRLLTIIDLFRENGVDAVPVRGPALAEDLYGDIVKRSFSDLDILICGTDLYQAVMLLEQNGFVSELKLTKAQMKQFVRHEYDFRLYQKKSHTIIELHWELSCRYARYPIMLKDFKNRIKTGSLIGKPVGLLPDDIKFLTTCIHSAKHCFERLEWIFSIAVMFNRFSEDELDQLLSLSKKMQCENVVLFSIYLCKVFFEINVPYRIQIIIDERGIDYDDMVASVIKYIERREESLNTRFTWLHLKFQDTLASKFFYAMRLVFLPTCGEWVHYPLPTRLTFFYYLIRPFRLLVEWVNRRGKTVKGKRSSKLKGES